MAPADKLRSTTLYAFAATAPAPPERDPRHKQDSAPDIEADERIPMTPIGDGPTEVARTFASIPPPPALLLPEEGDVVGQHYQLVRKLGGKCNAGRQWGYGPDYVWVTNGCRAEFGYGYANLAPLPGPARWKASASSGDRRTSAMITRNSSHCCAARKCRAQVSSMPPSASFERTR